jgi:hypothetical protein
MAQKQEKVQEKGFKNAKKAYLLCVLHKYEGEISPKVLHLKKGEFL